MWAILGPVPYLWFFSIDAIFHLNRSVVSLFFMFRFGLGEHIDYMLGRSIVASMDRTPVTMKKFRWGQHMSIYCRCGIVDGLRVIRCPAKVTRGNKTRITDCTDLKYQQQRGNDNPHNRFPPFACEIVPRFLTGADLNRKFSALDAHRPLQASILAPIILPCPEKISLRLFFSEFVLQ
jgi:hypothetical protein